MASQLSDLKTHWFSNFLRIEQLKIRLDADHLIIHTQDKTIKYKLSKLRELPYVTEELLFCTINIGKKQWRGLPKKKTTLFLRECHKAWYLSRLAAVRAFQEKASYYMTTRYVRSSKYLVLQKQAAKIKELYRFPPPQALLKQDQEQAFSFVEQVLSKPPILLNRSRENFIANEINTYKALFDSIESNPLTDRQREACVIDNDNNLVLAGAGTGKTSTMVGKAGYLVKSRKAKPNEILLLAFGKKAAAELQERIDSKLNNSAIQASTFHSLGKKIINQVEKNSLDVSDLATDDKKLNKYIDDCLTQLLTDDSYKKKAVEYFEKYLYPDSNPFDFKTKGEYLEYLEANDIRSLKGDLVKSHGELLIANFLFIHGIEYEYEAKYAIKTETPEFRQYKPDFYLCKDAIYLEHYGIDRNNNTAPFIDAKSYIQEIEWKRQTHQKNGTICLETFHYEKQEGSLLTGLAQKLSHQGVQLNPLREEDILDKLRGLGQISILSKLLSQLLCNIRNQYSTLDEALNVAKHANDSGQAMAALSLLVPIHNKYDQLLRENNEIDFNDMIHRATKYITEGKYKPRWKYILIDEFQDISAPRANLIKALRNHTENCAIFSVGDDWQSIFRFTGSNLSFTTKFHSEFGHCSTVKLDKTYRFNNSICDVATKFVTQNPLQEQKELKTHSHVNESAVSILRVDDSCNIDHIASVLTKIAGHVNQPSSVYVISRYNFLVDTDRLAFIASSYPLLNVKQISMHGSKGKEADFVIVVGLEKGKYGFPSEKVTHPLLELFLPPEEPFENAEERRLFYVAITRAKKRAYLIANMAKASPFMLELLKRNEYDLCFDEFETPTEQIEYRNLNCPSCSTGTLVIRSKKSTSAKFLGCSNYPRCEHIESCCTKCSSAMTRHSRFKVCINCGWKLPMCLKCSGEMQKRESTGHWGCSNYRGKHNYPTCTHQEHRITF